MSIDQFINKLGSEILNPVILILFAVALIVFLWGVFQMIYKSEEEGEREKGRQHILWGIIGMTIMVSAFGIIAMLMSTFGITDTRPIDSLKN